jgi:oxygen-independent coproporphyrinogen-3 oxidase
MQLIEKYNIPVPRYTSYPTVPYWNNADFTQAEFLAGIKDTEEGISLYIHLPFCESLCTYCGCNKYITVNHGHESPFTPVGNYFQQLRNYAGCCHEF